MQQWISILKKWYVLSKAYVDHRMTIVILLLR